MYQYRWKSMKARDRVCARNGICFSGVHVTSGSTETIRAAARKVNTMQADRCNGRLVVQLLRSRVKRRDRAYTTGVSSDQTVEIRMFHVSSCVQLSGLPMEAVQTCA